MASCKDCLHNEVCEAYSPRDTWATQHCAEECACFADRSEWVHFPCRVGDMVYTYNPDFSKVNENKVIQIVYDTAEPEYSVVLAYPNNSDSGYGVYHFCEFNKEIFTDKEKAESRQKELKENENNA